MPGSHGIHIEPVRQYLHSRRTHVATKVCCLLAALTVVSLGRLCVPSVAVTWVCGQQVLRNRHHCIAKRSTTSAVTRRAVEPGEQVSGIVMRRSRSGNLIVDIGEDAPAIIPAYANRNDAGEIPEVDDEIDLWIQSVAESGDYFGILQEKRLMTPERTSKFREAAESGEFLEGVVEHLRHPFAEVAVELADGTAGLGRLHVAELGLHWVEDVSEHLSVGDAISVHVREVIDGTGQLCLSARPALVVGQEFEGIVVSKVKSGAVFVDIGEQRQNVYLPFYEVADRSKLEVGDGIASLWIMNIDDRGVSGTLQEGKALTPQSRMRFMSTTGMVAGTVHSVEHPFAEIMLTLSDGTRGLGRMHVSEIGRPGVWDITEELSPGDDVSVRIRKISPDTGRLIVSMRSPLLPGQEREGIVSYVTEAGAALVDIGGGKGKEVYIPPQEVAAAAEGADLQVGDTIERLWILSVSGDRSRRPLGTLLEGKALSEEVRMELEAASRDLRAVFEGVVTSTSHPFANIMVKLADGTQVLGKLHVSDLGSGWVEDISEHISVGEDIHVRIRGVPDEHGRGSVVLEAGTPWSPGQEYEGRVAKITESGALLVDVGRRPLVYIHQDEVAKIGQVQPGDQIERLWILSISERGVSGTLQEGKALTEETKEKFEAAKAMEEAFLKGVVQGVRHPFAEIKVRLADGTPGCGKLHVSELGKDWVADIASVLSVGDDVSVRILQVSDETGLALSMRPSLIPGQEFEGTVKLIMPSGGAVIDIGKERQNIQLPCNEVVKFDPDMQIGDRIDRLWVMSVGDRSAHGTLREDYLLSPEAKRRLLEAAKETEQEDVQEHPELVFDGVVEYLRHPFADIVVSLPDGTSTVGSLHAREIGKGWVASIDEHLSIGEHITVRFQRFCENSGQLQLSTLYDPEEADRLFNLKLEGTS